MHSIRFRITLWFTVVILIIIIVLFMIFRIVSASVLRKTIRNYLISAVDSNINTIEYHDNSKKKNNSILPDDVIIEYGDGKLVIDADYLDVINDVEISIYSGDGIMLYGMNPLARMMDGTPFENSRIYSIDTDGGKYYIYDRKLIVNGTDDLWIRGVVPLEQERQQLSDISRIMAFFLPVIIIISVIGGYFTADRMLKPIVEMEEAATQISGGTDLRQRIKIGKGEDELHALAKAYNAMLERLERSFEAEKRFTSDASHELRTPMSVIMAQVELILGKERTAEEYQNALRVIRRQGGRMNSLINNMLDYTRLEQRADNYPLAPLDLSELSKTICEDMALIGRNNISLDYDIKPSIMIRGNKFLMERMLQNLIDNAYKYGNEDGHIYVSLRENNDKAFLSVKDDGIGISEEDRPFVFERFFRSDRSRNRDGNAVAGNGLGLSMVLKIAEMHGGIVNLECPDSGGSVFTVTIPEK